MTIIQSLILGLVQGLTEFFPVSSTGHLILLEKFFNLKAGLFFDVVLHLGTLLALLWFFRKTWLKLIKAFLRSFKKWNLKNDSEQRLVYFLILATIPAGIIGFLLEEKVETVFRSPLLIAITLAGFGLILMLVDKFSRKDKPTEKISIWDSLFIGFAQALALIPGISRSGATITAGRFAKLTREAAVEFSFLLSTPIIAGAGLSSFLKTLKNNSFSNDWTIYLVGFLTASISSYLAIKYLLIYVKNHSLNIFVFYRFLLAGIILAYLLLK